MFNAEERHEAAHGMKKEITSIFLLRSQHRDTKAELSIVT
jgi:hypothetical protein